MTDELVLMRAIGDDRLAVIGLSGSSLGREADDEVGQVQRTAENDGSKCLLANRCTHQDANAKCIDAAETRNRLLKFRWSSYVILPDFLDLFGDPSGRRAR